MIKSFSGHEKINFLQEYVVLIKKWIMAEPSGIKEEMLLLSNHRVNKRVVKIWI